MCVTTCQTPMHTQAYAARSNRTNKQIIKIDPLANVLKRRHQSGAAIRTSVCTLKGFIVSVALILAGICGASALAAEVLGANTTAIRGMVPGSTGTNSGGLISPIVIVSPNNSTTPRFPSSRLPASTRLSSTFRCSSTPTMGRPPYPWSLRAAC